MEAKIIGDGNTLASMPDHRSLVEQGSRHRLLGHVVAKGNGKSEGCDRIPVLP